MSEGVSPSKLAAQPIGAVARVADDLYQLKLPVPFPLRFVSAYLARGEEGWTLVDAGYDYPPAREAWESGAKAIGCDLGRDVSRIVVTHFHPDHLGAARWLQELSGAPVCMLGAEISFSRTLWGGSEGMGPFVGHLVLHGMDRGEAESAAVSMRSGVALPEEMVPLYPGEKVPLSGGAARVLHAPGHADHQLVLHDEARGILFAADHVLLKITPNIGLWPESEPRPLARYLGSLDGMRGLGAGLVLPGHGPVFHDLDGRIEELIRHHDGRLELIRRALGDGPKTSFAVSREVFRGDLTLYERCFALAETLAHLDHLALKGRAERLEDGAVSYRAA